MPEPLDANFFNRPTLTVATELLGKLLVVVLPDGSERALMITEVEAYDGPEDLASHASRGRTERTGVMFDEAGRWYMYLIYGMYWMLNIVTGPEGYPAAILIRGVGEYGGPGRLTKALGLDKRFNTRRADRETGLWVEDRGLVPHTHIVRTTPRIGVDYAGPIWAKKPYRFLLEADDGPSSGPRSTRSLRTKKPSSGR